MQVILIGNLLKKVLRVQRLDIKNSTRTSYQVLSLREARISMFELRARTLVDQSLFVSHTGDLFLLSLL